jgi:uncharacterized protein with LGFP repeats
MKRTSLALALAVSVLMAASSAAAFQVYGAIGDKWRELGAESGPLGAPLTDEADAARGGRFNAFQNGFIYWHPSFGAHAVYGEIGVKWNAMGRENGFGFPLTDELSAPGGGRYNDFENNGTIAWHPSTGAHAVYGLIRERWVALGREGGGCGYPTSDEYSTAGGRRSDFQGGYIEWRRNRRSAEAHCAGPIDNGTALNPVRE